MPLPPIGQIAFAALFMLAGLTHFLIPRFFLKIIPPWVPKPKIVNLLVGVVEIALGIALLFPTTQKPAAWGLIALLIAVFPANIYHFQQSMNRKKEFWPTLIRLPLQAVLVYWAYTFTF